LPNALSEHGKYVTFTGIRFEHGHDAIVAAIGRNLSGNKEDWEAISYRFLKDDKGWRVFVSVSLPAVKRVSRKEIGVIGIDLNADQIAVTETDRFGNPTEYFAIPCVTYGKTVHQRKAVIGDAIKQIIAFAILRRKPIVIEKLDFQKKKATWEKQAVTYARILAALAYTQMQTMIRARAYDAGIEVCEVDPAYSSVIGPYKFKDRSGMSPQNAAALVIGRRSLDFGESLPSQLHGTLPLSVRNRGGHVWSRWAVVSRKVSAAHAARRRSAIPDKRESRSSLSPAPSGQGTACDPSAWAGEIPACESSGELFG
jgi:IS605 OrfB family transposase